MIKTKINVIEDYLHNSGISFKSFLKKDYESYEPDEYQLLNQDDAFTFHFSWCKEHDKLIKQENEEFYNIVLYLNASIYDRGHLLGKFYEYEKVFQKLSNIKFKLLIIIVYYNYSVNNQKLDDKEFEVDQLNRVKQFQETLKLNANVLESNLICLDEFSNRKYQIEYILKMTLSTFSNSNNHNNIIDIKKEYDIIKCNEIIEKQELANQILSGTFEFKSTLELYIKLSSIDYSNIYLLLEKVVESLKPVLSFNGDQKLIYNNLKQLYLISCFENNFSVSNWLYQHLIKDKSKEILRNYTYVNECLMSRIASFGNMELFKYQFEKEIQQKDYETKVLKKLVLNYSIFNLYNWYGYLQQNVKIDDSDNILNWLMVEKNHLMDNETKFHWQCTLLMSSSSYGDLNSFKYILIHENTCVQADSARDDVNSIHIAVHSGKLNILEYINKQGKIDVTKSKSNVSEMFAIHYAAKLHNQEILDYLMENGADINCCDKTGATPLYYACSSYYSLHNYETTRDTFTLSFCKNLIKKYNAKKVIQLNGKKFNIVNNYLNNYYNNNCIIS